MIAKYQKPDWLTKHVFNPLVMLLTSRGLSVRGSRILVVRWRKSGQIRTRPVNPLEIAGQRYLVAPREETEWVRNLRAARGGDLRLGRHREPIGAEELPDELKPPILREYLRRWKIETGEVLRWCHSGVPRIGTPANRSSSSSVQAPESIG